MRIGLFDSGIGGLTVLAEFINKYPNCEYIYYGDTANLPYGTKSKEELSVLADKIIKFLISKKIDLIVIACGTISSNLYSEIKDKYNVKIIDILTPTINYITQNKLNNIGIMATPMTVKSQFFEKRLVNVTSIACPKLVPLIECGEFTDELKQAVKEYLQKLKGCDYIILGCTHYPLIIPIIQKYSTIPFINMGKCLVDTINVNSKSTLHIELYFSKLTNEIITNVSKIIKENKKIYERKV